MDKTCCLCFGPPQHIKKRKKIRSGHIGNIFFKCNHLIYVAVINEFSRTSNNDYIVIQ